jgi:hypothetical protein
MTRSRRALIRKLIRQLLGGHLVAVDENQAAPVERHCPSRRRANKVVLTDIHSMPGQVAEILGHRATNLAVGTRMDAHPDIHRHAAAVRRAMSEAGFHAPTIARTYAGTGASMESGPTLS